MSNQMLPKYWISCELKKLGKILSGGTPSTKSASYWSGEIPWISSADIYGIKDIRPRRKVSKEAISNSATNLLPKGNILVVTRVGLGKLALNEFDICFSQDIQGIVLDESIYNEYVIYILSTCVLSFLSNNQGTTIAGVTKKQLEELVINICPYAEQRAIVTKLETLLSELDNAVVTLKQVKEQLKTYRQAVLKAAFTGKLTEEWREQNTSVSLYDLTKSVCDLREYRADCPEVWALYSFTDVCSIDSNLVIPDEYLDYPHIAPDNIEKGSGKLIDYNSVKQDGVRSPKHKFFNGQIIYSKIRPYLSKATLVGFDGLCSADMYPLTSKINSKYLLFYILSTTFVEMASTAGTRSLLPKINQKELSKIPVPITSKEEQQQIVSEIETRFSTADKLEQTIDDSLSKTEALKQSLLKQAFEGKLLTEQELEQTRQAPDWEPAEKILENIHRTKIRE